MFTEKYEGVLLEWLSGIQHHHRQHHDDDDDKLRRRQRQVSFASDDDDDDDVMVVKQTHHDILSLADYTTNEIKACWYTPKDKTKMKMKHDVDVARFESGLPPRGGKHATFRGLEAWSVEGGAELESNIHRCVDAVMDEQEIQWSTYCGEDHNKIALVSIQTTSASKRLAYEIGQYDALEAAAIYSADKQSLDALSSHSTSSTSTTSTAGSIDTLDCCYEIPLSTSSSYGKKSSNSSNSSCRRRSSSYRKNKHHHHDTTTASKLVSSVQKSISNNQRKNTNSTAAFGKHGGNHQNQKVVVLQNMLPKKLFNVR